MLLIMSKPRRTVSLTRSVIVGSRQLALFHSILDLAHVRVVRAPRELATMERTRIED